jgi:hypothetical protein
MDKTVLCISLSSRSNVQATADVQEDAASALLAIMCERNSTQITTDTIQQREQPPGAASTHLLPASDELLHLLHQLPLVLAAVGALRQLPSQERRQLALHQRGTLLQAATTAAAQLNDEQQAPAASRLRLSQHNQMQLQCYVAPELLPFMFLIMLHELCCCLPARAQYICSEPDWQPAPC